MNKIFPLNEYMKAIYALYNKFFLPDMQHWLEQLDGKLVWGARSCILAGKPIYEMFDELAALPYRDEDLLPSKDKLAEDLALFS